MPTSSTSPSGLAEQLDGDFQPPAQQTAGRVRLVIAPVVAIGRRVEELGDAHTGAATASSVCP